MLTDQAPVSQQGATVNIRVFTSCKIPEFFEKSPLSGAKKHPDFQGQVDRGNFTFSLSENRT